MNFFHGHHVSRRLVQVFLRNLNFSMYKHISKSASPCSNAGFCFVVVLTIEDLCDQHKCTHYNLGISFPTIFILTNYVQSYIFLLFGSPSQLYATSSHKTVVLYICISNISAILSHACPSPYGLFADAIFSYVASSSSNNLKLL